MLGDMHISSKQCNCWWAHKVTSSKNGSQQISKWTLRREAGANLREALGPSHTKLQLRVQAWAKEPGATR